jgi:hypothetical protein
MPDTALRLRFVANDCSVHSPELSLCGMPDTALRLRFVANDCSVHSPELSLCGMPGTALRLRFEALLHAEQPPYDWV